MLIFIGKSSKESNEVTESTKVGEAEMKITEDEKSEKEDGSKGFFEDKGGTVYPSVLCIL